MKNRTGWVAVEEDDMKILKCVAVLETEVSQEVRSDPQSEISYRTAPLRMSELPLPEYSHSDGESLEYFLKSFESVIDKYKLSSYEKFIYLQKQLKKEPLVLIKSLEVRNPSYEEAKELLSKVFASIRSQ